MRDIVRRVGRLVFVALVYLAGAAVVDVLIQELVPILVLPPLFMTLARAMMALGLVILLAAMWIHERPPG